MSKSLTIIWQYLRAFVLIYACLYAGIFIAGLLPITIPGSIIGMLILFVLLALQIMPPQWVNPGCNILIRYMALLFRADRRWGDAVLGSAARPAGACRYLLRHQYAGGVCSGELELPFGAWRT
ncbi:Antiholin-like protein LrgA [Klebsiella pneumoniae]|nr:Antiholin-like protein LrgA [Klebsiella pneumoniae]